MDFAYSRVARQQPQHRSHGQDRRASRARVSSACSCPPAAARRSRSRSNSCALIDLAFGTGKRTKVITLQPSYHGGTMFALAMSGDDDLSPISTASSLAGAGARAAHLSPAGQPHRGDLCAILCRGARRQDCELWGRERTGLRHGAGRRARHRLQRCRRRTTTGWCARPAPGTASRSSSTRCSAVPGVPASSSPRTTGRTRSPTSS